jgi:Cu-Zn family superoxide dismutase
LKKETSMISRAWRFSFVVATVLAIVLFAGCGGGDEPVSEGAGEGATAEGGYAVDGNFAEAMIDPRSGSALSGMAIFTENDGTITVTLDVEGAPPGIHAAHLHQFGDCSSVDGKSAGGHWNPSSKDHGQWGHDPFHLGDLGNVVVDEAGYGSLTLTTDKWELGTGGDLDIVGLGVIVHASADDFTSQPSGAAGARIGCGVVVKK